MRPCRRKGPEISGIDSAFDRPRRERGGQIRTRFDDRRPVRLQSDADRNATDPSTTFDRMAIRSARHWQDQQFPYQKLV